MAAPIQLPRLHDRDGLFDEGVRSSKRAKYAPEQRFSKQSTSFAALEEDEDVLRHGEEDQGHIYHYMYIIINTIILIYFLLIIISRTSSQNN